MRGIRRTPFVAAFLWLGLYAAQARMIHLLSIDDDPPKCDAILIAKVISIAEEGLVDAQRELDGQKIKVKVEFPIKAPFVRGQSFNVLHYRWSGWRLRKACANCFLSFDFQPDSSYLLFLKKDKTGRYSLMHADDLIIIKFSDEMIRAARSVAPDKNIIEHILDIVWAAFQLQTDNCSSTLYILNSSRSFARRIENPGVRNALVARLHDLTRTAKDESTLAATYNCLAKLGDMSMIPRIADFIINGPGTSVQRTNAINWLSPFPWDAQAKALKMVLENSKDKSVLDYAARKLSDPNYSQTRR